MTSMLLTGSRRAVFGEVGERGMLSKPSWTLLSGLMCAGSCGSAGAAQVLSCSVSSIDSESVGGVEVKSTPSKYEYMIEFTPSGATRYDKNGSGLWDFKVATTSGLYTRTSHVETTNIYGELLESTVYFTHK